jgi:glycosyltransferase involved in cell wall biosynthesis
MRVAFTLIGGRLWTGGYNYLLNLVRSLAAHRPDAITPVLCFGEDTDPEDAAPFEQIANAQVVRHGAFDASRRGIAVVRSLLLGRDAAIQSIFARERIDVVFENAQFNGWRAAQPAIAWIPDFQHRFLPHLFTSAGYWKRELGFRMQIATGRTIMLSSEDSRLACERFHSSTAGRTHVVPFAVPMPPGIDPASARTVADRHGLPARYLFMPNQFWQHKNHALVIEALELLRQSGRDDVVVAASGKTLDPRRPDHFPSLQARVAQLKLERQFRILGMVPYEDLAPLMRASDALLNPSLFEGWSTTVEEARAAGVPMLLSDLEVHREQAGSHARFFDRHSPASLAQQMAATPLPSRADDAALAVAASARVQTFADKFVALVHSSLPRGA